MTDVTRASRRPSGGTRTSSDISRPPYRTHTPTALRSCRVEQPALVTAVRAVITGGCPVLTDGQVPFRASFECAGPAVLVHVAGEIDYSTAPELAECLSEAVRS